MTGLPRPKHKGLQVPGINIYREEAWEDTAIEILSLQTSYDRVRKPSFYPIYRSSSLPFFAARYFLIVSRLLRSPWMPAEITKPEEKPEL